MPKKNAPTQTKKATPLATPRSTSGAGFDFEDHVAAWFLLKALTGQELPGIKGKVSRLQMQVNALGWYLDDVLFITDAGPGDERHLAISAKSNVQVSAGALPAEFVELAWKQWDPRAVTPMRRDVDCLMLATRQRHPVFQASWSDVKLWAEDADATLALARIQSTATHTRIFDSVKSPAKAVGLTVTDGDVLALIKRMTVMPFDFDVAGGEYETMALAESRRLLASGDLGEGRSLWDYLVNRAKSLRLAPSTLDLHLLWQELRSRFALRDHPNFLGAWDKLRAITNEYRSEVQTTLPSDISLKREVVSNKLVEAISKPVCIVYGDSGTGKSALVKMVLDSRFPNAVQVWLGPEQLEMALSETSRPILGLHAPLLDVLMTSANSQTILVIDAAEHLKQSVVLRAQGLIASLAATGSVTHCRVVIVGQTEAWSSGRLQKLAGATSPPSLDVPPVETGDVIEVLRATAGLRWLAMQDDAVSALTNLKALAWVIEGATLFHAQGGVQQLSLTAIADRLWDYWTGAKPSLQRLLMTLSEREASFERSFALTNFTAAEAVELNALPIACPFGRNNANRYHFEHDLAADWARFQRLKELSENVNSWASFAGNPSWNNALRMLGQFLLRQPSETRTRWDVAFEEAEALHDTMPLAADILLDALFLDPSAEEFLNQRADMLFANGSKRLLRLLRRFEHVASVPGVPPLLIDGGIDISLYLETQYRTPRYGYWPAVSKFLTKHIDHIVKLMSPAVAAVCDRWLTTTPLDLGDGTPTPLRKQFADIALGSARELQLGQETRVIFMDDMEKPIYAAAFSGTPDLPGEVTQWALEMAQRRALSPDLVERAGEFHRKQAEEHRKKLEIDSEYRKRQTRPRSVGVAFSSRRKLPSWPLGPQKRVDQRFRETVLSSISFHSVMRFRPAAASEILLAAIIEGEPVEEYGSSAGLDDNLGLAYDHDGYPTAYWKSPFFAFLKINPEMALSTLHQLVNFATHRWVQEVQKRGGHATPSFVDIGDGTAREYFGGHRVFSWSQENTHQNGQLHSALAALEKWLTSQIDQDREIAAYLEDLLKNTKSVSVLGVLINIGKYKPALFHGPLRPLLGLSQLYFWDSVRVDSAGFSFDGMTWARSGDFVFQMARDWITAPYRQRKLRQIASEMIAQETEVAQFVLLAMEQWSPPENFKAALEFRILTSELDHRNFKRTVDAVSGGETTEFHYPADVARDISAFQQDVALSQQVLRLPEMCRSVFREVGSITPQSAAWLTELIASIDGSEEIDLDEEYKRAAKVAAASTLLVRATDWLAEHPAMASRAQLLVDAVIADIDIGSEELGPRYRENTALEFAAYVVSKNWIEAPSEKTDQAIMKVITSGHDRATQVLFASAYARRDELGGAWWRLQYIALMWAGLSVLAPRYDDDAAAPVRWQRWLGWLRTRRISGMQASINQINPLSIAKRVERFERRRWRQRAIRDGLSDRVSADGRHSGGLAAHFLEQAFSWLFVENLGLTDNTQQTTLVTAFWSYEAWCRSGSADGPDKDYQPMGQLGYAIVSAITRLILSSPVAAAPSLFLPVFEVGPRGHYTIGAFLRGWFSLLADNSNCTEFSKRWRPMIEFMLNSEDWVSGRQWYHGEQLQRQVLGFGADSYITRAPDHAQMIDSLRGLYSAWAEKRLGSNEDNIAGLCGFLSTHAGQVLRMDGLEWIATAIRADHDVGMWHRRETSTAFMAFLDVVVSEHSEELAKNSKARKALVELAAHGVSRQLPTALALQERVRLLR